jgi:hypothetical protein
MAQKEVSKRDLAWQCIVENIKKSLKWNLRIAKNHDLEQEFLDKINELVRRLQDA